MLHQVVQIKQNVDYFQIVGAFQMMRSIVADNINTSRIYFTGKVIYGQVGIPMSHDGELMIVVDMNRISAGKPVALDTKRSAWKRYILFVGFGYFQVFHIFPIPLSLYIIIAERRVKCQMGTFMCRKGADIYINANSGKKVLIFEGGMKKPG